MMYYRIILFAVFVDVSSNIYADNVTPRITMKQRQSSESQDKPPDCGRLSATNFNEEGTEELYTGSVPWNVGIYQISNNKNYRIICGGTLIASNLVVSAAQCFWQEGLRDKILKNLNEYKVIIGKYEENNKIIDDEFTQIIDMDFIYLNEGFRGLSKYYANDIAIIVLSANVQISDDVLPVCVDWTKRLNNPRSSGKTIGLGITEKKIPSSTINLSFITRKQCQSYYSNDFELYLTNDKFCAEPQPQDNDRNVVVGAGLAFENHNNLHFLIGVASVKDPDPTDTITAFTDVKQHIPWIRSIYKNHTGMEPIPVKNAIIQNNSSKPSQSQNRNTCVIPKIDSNVYYFKNQGSVLSPGSKFDSSRKEVEVHCKEGYNKLLDNNLIFCSNGGKWYPEDFEKFCWKECKPINIEGMVTKYTYNEDDVDSLKPIKPGTKVKPECNKVSYKPNNPKAYKPKVLNCLRSGMWSDEIDYSCVPRCGLNITQSPVKPLIGYGLTELNDPSPWNVGVYRKNFTIDMDHLICGGTLITQNLVVSAAHCFEVPNNSIYKIAVGKYQANISIIDNVFTKILNVQNIHPHENYSGESDFYVNDIAVIVLSSNVQFISTTVLPVCMDWSNFYINSLVNGADGKVAGWGQNEYGVPSTELKVAHLPYIDRKSCRNSFDESFHQYLWNDKFCAGHLNETEQSVQQGDSGSGLTFMHNNLHYLTGIVSINRRGSRNSIAAFTDVRYHINWLTDIYNRYS